VPDNPIELNPFDIPNLNDVVYDTLRKAILQYDFAPGQRLDLSDLEDRLQVSRTPLKHAMTRLEVEGLVQVQARRGTFVTEISAAKLDEDYKIRSAYELYVVLCLFKYLKSADYDFFTEIGLQMDDLALQARKSGWQDIIHEYLDLDRALHQKMIACGGTPRMLSLWQQTNVHMQVSRIANRIPDRDFDGMHFEHRQILDALTTQSSERLNAVLLNHLESSRLGLVRILSS
jgi:DNA-binding GntR family transcriptional regulator